MAGRKSHSFILVLMLGLNVGHVEGKEDLHIHEAAIVKNRYGVSLTVREDGVYSIGSSVFPTLHAGETAIHYEGTRYSSREGTLSAVDMTTRQVEDPVLGRCQQVDVIWETTTAKIATMFKLFDDFPAVTFTQNFTHGGLLNTSRSDDNKLISKFPSLILDEAEEDIGFLSFGGLFFMKNRFGRWSENNTGKIHSGRLAGPTALFTADGDTVVISPASQFIKSFQLYDGVERSLSYGISGRVKSIPKDFSMETILYFGHGVKNTIHDWGRILLQKYRTVRATHRDMTVKYLGYWTDRGAGYYDHPIEGKTWEDTMAEVKEQAVKDDIPYRYYQLDAWWYYRGLGHGIKNWTPRPDILPNGMSHTQKVVDTPLALHSRYWSPDTDYAKVHGGLYDFIIENNMSLPNDTNFFCDLFRNVSDAGWHMVLYEQVLPIGKAPYDSKYSHKFARRSSKGRGVVKMKNLVLNSTPEDQVDQGGFRQDSLKEHYLLMDTQKEDIHIGRDWLIHMGDCATVHDVVIQYCKMYPMHILQSVEIPAVTQMRASGDFLVDPGQWDIGITSIISEALDLRPFKDNFRTTDNQGIDHSPVKLHTVASVLSTGPVGPGDLIGYSDVASIKSTCRSDGLLLQPSKPAMAIDDFIIRSAFSKAPQLVWTTFSEISGFTFGIILAIDVSGPEKFTPDRLDLEMSSGQHYAYHHESTETTTFDAQNPLIIGPCNQDDVSLVYTSPGFKIGEEEFILLGETSKYVPVSPDRIKSIIVLETSLSFVLDVAENEAVALTLKTVGSGGDVFEVTCPPSKLGGLVLLQVFGVGQVTCSTASG